ncbi:hypothetical protein [Paenibacillus hexagrammi]|uniref:Uncharacterized protein n=1 Tax=Paenibacillus hexagrammi TaxID=2908839 RepID=A0ABY3SM20_9BACL|nr:hypothetical protein [Paenibacillus sp. YPD9-1]UJF34923.1 hypothetical protein L0M14_07195 [Paenibacillus sp. YPD9-1]
MQIMKKRLVTLGLVSLVTVASVLSGCSKGSESASPAPDQSAAPQASASASGGIDTSKEVKLKTVLLGSKPKDFDEVYAEVNKIMKQKINATLDVSFWTGASTSRNIR